MLAVLAEFWSVTPATRAPDADRSSPSADKMPARRGANCDVESTIGAPF
jgi:hypothetical protein